MNSSFQLFILGFILALLIILSLSNIDPIPYHEDSLFKKEFPFEGMGTLAAPAVAALNVTDKKKDLVKTEGFEGLQSSPYTDEKPIDLFSQLKASNSCTPSPYSNSQGYLCLDDQTKQLLLTRGGNQTSESQIGQK